MYETATTATPRMLHIIVTELINERYSDPFIRARERVQVEIEGLVVAASERCAAVATATGCSRTRCAFSPNLASNRAAWGTGW